MQPTITKEQALALKPGDMLHTNHQCEMRLKQTEAGTPAFSLMRIMRWKVTGKPQSWKTRPDEFRVPIKFGLRDSDALTHVTADLLHREADCPGGFT